MAWQRMGDEVSRIDKDLIPNAIKGLDMEKHSFEEIGRRLVWNGYGKESMRQSKDLLRSAMA